MAKSDIRDSIIRDTTAIANSHRKTMEMIKRPGIERDRNAKLGYRYESKEQHGDTIFSYWSILQDGIEIGTMEQRAKLEYGKYTMTYVVYKELNDEKATEVPIAIGYPSLTSIKIATIIDNKSDHSASLGNENNVSAETDPIGVMVKYLIAKRYL